MSTGARRYEDEGRQLDDADTRPLRQYETVDVEDGNTERLEQEHPQQQASYGEIALSFSTLGWIAFGGPPAHLGFFQKRFVERKHWLKHGTFGELISLAQCLPGPSSTQVSFALGALQRGIPGGLLSGISFQHPGAIIMSIAGVGAADLLKDPPPLLDAFTSGLSAAGIGLVVDAAFNLTAKLCTTRLTQVLGAFAAIITFYFGGETGWVLPVLILGSGVVTGVYQRIVTRGGDDGPDHHQSQDFATTENSPTKWIGLGIRGGIILLAVWAAILIGSISLRSAIGYSDAPVFFWFEAFYRTGSLIFGGGQVVLPLLLGNLKDGETGKWISDKEFFTGLGIVQSMPGPLFNLSAFLGAVIAKREGMNPMSGIATCWLGLFSPGVMLIFALLPLWSRFRRFRLYKDSLGGFNGAAFGCFHWHWFCPPQLSLQLVFLPVYSRRCWACCRCFPVNVPQSARLEPLPASVVRNNHVHFRCCPSHQSPSPDCGPWWRPHWPHCQRHGGVLEAIPFAFAGGFTRYVPTFSPPCSALCTAERRTVGRLGGNLHTRWHSHHAFLRIAQRCSLPGCRYMSSSWYRDRRRLRVHGSVQWGRGSGI